MKLKIVGSTFLLAYVGASRYLLEKPRNLRLNPLFPDGSKVVFAHRGGAAEHPENSLIAFKHCHDSSLVLETDCHMTKDGIVVLSHDATTFRLTSVAKVISETNYEDLPSYKDTVFTEEGQPVKTSNEKYCTLETLFTEVPVS